MIWAIAKAFGLGLSADEIHELTKIQKLHNIHVIKTTLATLDYFGLQHEKPLI